MNQASWDREAATFDDEPDHGLADAEHSGGLARSAPGGLATCSGADRGSRVRHRDLDAAPADEGFVVDGLDFSPEMVRRARGKVPEAEFVVADAAGPALEPGAYDAS